MDMRTRTEGALLTKGDYYGTLAAARCLGSSGIPVYLADSALFTQTRLSNFVARRVRAPAVEHVPLFAAWLAEFGRVQPGLFLYSTCDDMSWILASRRDDLRRHYLLWQPSLDTIAGLLDKQRLYATCTDLGIEVPLTYAPTSEEAVRGIAATAAFPLLIKPRTQMLLTTKRKGRLVSRREDLAEVYRRFRAQNTYLPEILEFDPDIAWPLLQEYLPRAAADTYSLSGFIDPAQGIFVARAARKLFQRPARFGVGLCFRSAPVQAALCERVRALARRTRYYGVFEAEFVHGTGGAPLLIDFNPRFYGQMGFDVARGVPLPFLAYDAARGSHHLARRIARERDTSGETWWAGSRWLLRFAMLTQSLSGQLDRGDRRLLQQLMRDPKLRAIDAVRSDNDAGPMIADVLLNLVRFARHPRDFGRTFFQA